MLVASHHCVEISQLISEHVNQLLIISSVCFSIGTYVLAFVISMTLVNERAWCILLAWQQCLLLLLISGVLVEGFMSMIASMVGTGTGLSSFRDNVGVLDVTKVVTCHSCY